MLRTLISAAFLTFALHLMGKPITFIWDLTELKALRSQPTSQAYKQVVNLANMRMKSGVVAVTDKKTTISGNKHEFESLSIYWWPDPKNPGGPYIAKDGEYNPEYKQYDYPRLLQLVENLRDCSKAFFLTGNLAYYGFFCHQLDTWFIDAETCMQPDFNYCQFIPGRNDNRGNPQGMADIYNFNDVIESVRLVHSEKSIGRKRMKALKAWFKQFADWMQTSEYGQTAANFKNGQTLTYDLTLYDMLIFTGNKSGRKAIRNEYPTKRLFPQIEADGRMPEALQRTKALSYSNANLQRLVEFGILTKNDGAPLPSDCIQRIGMAFDYIAPFCNKQKSFPYSEIGNWEEQTNLFRRLQNRFKELSEPPLTNRR